ncbi:hypothetical protein PFISCL1PPCAC_20796, partial [Pristionchus fissidentatus]
FLDVDSYRTYSPPQLLTMQPDYSQDIVAFCPAYTAGGPSIDNLFGIYALTAQGQHVFRSFSGPDNKIVSTTVIATDVIDQCSYVSPCGHTVVVAYGERSIHLSEHRPYWEKRAPPCLLSISSPISRCFVHSNHIVVCTDEKIVFLHTWKLLDD